MKYSKKTEKDIIKKAVDALKKGKLIVYPTDTIYGIGADATSKKAVSKVYKIKKRKKSLPLSVMVSNKTMLKQWSYPSKKSLEKLPGKYTFILEPKKKLPVAENDIGFRIPKHWCTKIAKQFGKPIVTTSANISEKKTPNNIKDIEKTFGKSIAVYIDDRISSKKPSKIIAKSGKRIR